MNILARVTGLIGIFTEWKPKRDCFAILKSILSAISFQILPFLIKKCKILHCLNFKLFVKVQEFIKLCSFSK